MQKSILIIGGTGIIGKATVFEALKLGYEVTTISLEKDTDIPQAVNQIIINRKNRDLYSKIISDLNDSHGKWNIVFDVYNLDANDAEQTFECFADYAEHFFIVSTTLVYDRSKKFDLPIKSSHHLAPLGTMGGYVDCKIQLENFWRKIDKKVAWTILRPYHILGAGSYLGCIPNHNRDPLLVQRIKNGESLQLCDGGAIEINCVHPTDIARIVFTAYGKSETYSKAYNAVNPEKVLARNYYEQIGISIGINVKIENKSIQKIWEESRGWELTTLPHIYDTSDLESEIGFVPSITMEESIKDALANLPTQIQTNKISVHERMTLLPRPQKLNWLLEN